ncbi:MAG: hypothetical protein ACR2P4_01130 [Gammaproteobacteria bacterium]
MATKKQTNNKPSSAEGAKPAIIRIGWDEKSYPLSDFAKKQKPLMDKRGDWGIYQIYGEHPAYGSDTLLYIGLCGEGKNTKQTIGKRVSQHPEFMREPYHSEARVYVGHLISESPGIKTGKAQQEWADHICRAEKLLIFFHKPAYNSTDITGISEELSGMNIRVFNFGNCRKLQGEVSSDFYREYNEKYTEGKFKPYRLS